MADRSGERVEMVMQARGCPHGRHRPHLRACAWDQDRPCACRREVAIDDLLGGRVEE